MSTGHEHCQNLYSLSDKTHWR